MKALSSIFSKLFPFTSHKSLAENDTERLSERNLLLRAAENFHNLKVEDVMVPRAEIIAIEKSVGLKTLAVTLKDAGHSRLPAYNDTLDDPIGMVHVKDVFAYLSFDAKGRNTKTYPTKKVVNSILRPVLYVPPSMSAEDLLRKMQVKRIHMAIVVDEYGGTDGLVTLEDLIEPIVGDIEDEHDEAEPDINARKTAKGEIYWDVDARADIEDFEAVFGRDIATPEEDEEVDTIGGVVVSLAGRVPLRGEIVRHPYGIEFEILDADPRRIKRIRVRTATQTSI